MAEEQGLNHSICLKEYINQKDYEEINNLQKICRDKDRTNLKLELDYKLHLAGHSEIRPMNSNEFLYYADGSLISYLGICSFGGNSAEINGMTHPDWRRKGIFSRLLGLALEECRRRNFADVLLLTDRESAEGTNFIVNAGGIYDFSEYRMQLILENCMEDIPPLCLAETILSEGNESPEVGDFEEAEKDQIIYRIEISGEKIGTVKIKYGSDPAFISGFQLLPEERGKGYGKKAFKEALRLIFNSNIKTVELDVDSQNEAALHLYRSFGFRDISIMDYYRK